LDIFAFASLSTGLSGRNRGKDELTILERLSNGLLSESYSFKKHSSRVLEANILLTHPMSSVFSACALRPHALRLRPFRLIQPSRTQLGSHALRICRPVLATIHPPFNLLCHTIIAKMAILGRRK
jgi:hypothetical protein